MPFNAGLARVLFGKLKFFIASVGEAEWKERTFGGIEFWDLRSGGLHVLKCLMHLMSKSLSMNPRERR